MRFGAKFRLLALAAGLALAWLLIGLMTVRSQRQAGFLRARLSQLESESFRVADDFRDDLRKLNESLYHYGRSHTSPDVAAFMQASDELDRWLEAQKPKLTTASEKAVMEQMNTTYDDYRRAASALLDRLAALGDASATVDEYTDLRKESQRLFDLSQSLAKARFDSQRAVLAQAGQDLTQLRRLVLIALAGLFLLGVALAWFAYRDLIAPLRTRLVENQTLLERQEKLASLGLLAAGVAHEIRNPLTAIKAALFIQQKKLRPGTEDYADSKLVERELLRLEKIVSDFLLFARPVDPELEPVVAGRLLHEVRALLETALAKTGIQLIVEDSQAVRLCADAAQIKQVLINLVQNAADAIGEKGTVTLRARTDRRRLQNREQDVVILEVADTGRGIPPEVEKRLFDPFFTTKESGTGLGLCIAAGIVQKHGGALQYQTRVDSGTIFGIILPQVIA